MTIGGTSDFIAGLDIGTSKVVAVIGRIYPDGVLEVIGLGTAPSKGLKKGVIVNIESTVNAIQQAIEEAELMAGCRVQEVCVGIAGGHIRSINSHGIVAIRDREVHSSDIERVIEAAQAVAIPADQRILHVIPQEYAIDSQIGVRDPLGMSGVRLEARVHVVTCAINASQNVEKCVQRCGLSTECIILEQLASSQAVLADDEKELGVCLIDIGGGTTDIAVYVEGSVRHTLVIPIAGYQVTNDIAMSLRTPTHYAEDIKTRHACALTRLADPESIIKVPSVGERPPSDLSRYALAEVVEPRYEELFYLVLSELRRQGLEDAIPAGIVLTGGASKIEGAVELAEEIFNMPVRLGIPRAITGLQDVIRNPIYATAIGLLLYGNRERQTEVAPKRRQELFGGVFAKVGHWFRGHF